MNFQDVRKVAKDLGVKPGKMNKANLIKTIQLTEGNFDCFAAATSGVCDQISCTWRDDCFTSAKKIDH